MKIDFEKKFKELEENMLNKQKKIPFNSNLGVFYGYSGENCQRVSFLSNVIPTQIESTKMIKVIQGKEGDSNNYWTCFDLLDNNYKKIFFAFCEDLLNSIENKDNEIDELKAIKDRFYIWKVMFKKSQTTLNSEKEQGLFGELFFLNKYMIEKYGADKAISSWVGPLGYPKDFSIDKSWYEVKTTDINSIKIKISSLAQLSSKDEGRLIVVKTEKMSENFDNNSSSVIELINEILSKKMELESREMFLKKVNEYGFDFETTKSNNKFSVGSVDFYVVNQDFPKLTDEDIKYQEIEDVNYCLIIKTLERFKVNEL